MGKYYIPRVYCCSICHESYDNELSAIDCFDAHCKEAKILNLYYEKKEIYPNRLIVKFISNNEKKLIPYIREYNKES